MPLDRQPWSWHFILPRRASRQQLREAGIQPLKPGPGGPAHRTTLHGRPRCPALPRAGAAARCGSAWPAKEDPRGP